MVQIRFKRWICYVTFAKYPDGRTAIQLISRNAEPVATATIHIPQCSLKENEVIIKNNEENIGMLNILIDAGIVSMPTRYLKTGGSPNCVEYPICNLLVSPNEGS